MAKIDIAGREDEVRSALDDIVQATRNIANSAPGTISKRAISVLEHQQLEFEERKSQNDGVDSLVSAALVSGNFLTAIYKRLLPPVASFGKLHLDAAIDASVTGTKELASRGPLLLLAYLLGGQTLAIATLFTVFKPLRDAHEATVKSPKKLEDSETD